MFSTSSPSMLFALLILILQTLAVLALPTSTPAASTSSQLDTRQSSDSSNNNGNDNNNNHADGTNVTASNKVTPAQIAGVVIGALCLIALALIFSYCFVQRQRRKRELRAAEKAAAIERTKRVDPSFEYAGGICEKPLV